MEGNLYGRRIRAFRKLKRMQQVEFAKRLGISTTILGRMERGEKVVTEEMLLKIAQELQIDINELKGN